ncbi:MAG: hypothetical protein KAU24_03750 [Candidatus Aenigmarchaeota archaeon]|nr:hypothetical protein [Candidatus Aenigmarchaeota archaeon]
MRYEKKFQELKERLDRAEEFDPSMIGQVLSGDISLGKATKSFAASKAKKMVSKYTKKAKYRNPLSRKFLMPFDSDYRFVKNVVGDAISGRSRYDIQEVSHIYGGNLGEHGPDGIRVLKTSEIPGIFGKRYGNVLRMVKKGPEQFNQDVQNYIRLHEVAESEYMRKYGINKLGDEEHGRFEAYLLKSLETLPTEGYDTTGVLEGAVAVHSMRKASDRFLKKTKKYNKKLGDWINMFLSPQYTV